MADLPDYPIMPPEGEPPPGGPIGPPDAPVYPPEGPVYRPGKPMYGPIGNGNGDWNLPPPMKGDDYGPETKPNLPERRPSPREERAPRYRPEFEEMPGLEKGGGNGDGRLKNIWIWILILIAAWWLWNS